MGEAIGDAALCPYRVALRRPWCSAQGMLSERRGWLVRLRAEGALEGFGECAPLPAAGTEDAASGGEGLSRVLRWCLGGEPRAVLSRLRSWRGGPAARCAVESALLDLLARRAGLPLARWLNPGAPRRVQVNAALGAIDTGLDLRVRQAIAQGYTVLKLKAGVHELDAELRGLCALAKILPPGVGLRLDVNRAWDAEQALEALRTLCRLPIESLEEPLRDPEPDALRRLQARVPWPLALDESLDPHNTPGWLSAAPVRRLILKPMVQGGVLAAFELARAARRRGLECVVTTTLDAAAGVWAAAQLAAALGPGGVHGLGTGAWLRGDLGRGPVIRQAQLHLAAAPGLGFRPHPGTGFVSIRDQGRGHAL